MAAKTVESKQSSERQLMKSLRRTFRTKSTKRSSSWGAAKARWPLKSTRSKQRNLQTTRLANLTRKGHTVFMAFSPGWWNNTLTSLGDECHFCITLFGCSNAALGYAQKTASSRIEHQPSLDWTAERSGEGTRR